MGDKITMLRLFGRCGSWKAGILGRLFFESPILSSLMEKHSMLSGQADLPNEQ